MMLNILSFIKDVIKWQRNFISLLHLMVQFLHILWQTLTNTPVLSAQTV